MTNKKVTIVRIGSLNQYEIRVGGVPKISATGKLNAERRANILRKKMGRRTIA